MRFSMLWNGVTLPRRTRLLRSPYSPRVNLVRANWWLRSVNSATNACNVNNNGNANNNSASNSNGVRPISVRLPCL